MLAVVNNASCKTASISDCSFSSGSNDETGGWVSTGLEVNIPQPESSIILQKRKIEKVLITLNNITTERILKTQTDCDFYRFKETQHRDFILLSALRKTQTKFDFYP